jgi:hypothetical protein
MTSKSAPSLYYPIAEAIQAHGVSRELMLDMMADGRFELMHNIQREFPVPFDLTEAALDFAFDGPRRSLIYPELIDVIRREEPPRSGLARKVCGLAEFQGRVTDWGRALSKCFAQLEKVAKAEDRSWPSDEYWQASQLAYLLNDTARLEGVATSDPLPERAALNRAAAARFRRFMTKHQLDAEQPRRMLEAVAEGRPVRFERPTVVVRTSTTFWDAVQTLPECGEEALVDSLVFLPMLRGLGLDVVLIPQTFNAGPAFAAPFDLDDPNLVCIIANHKYSYRVHPKLLNYRRYFSNRYLLDYGGYSGWTITPPLSELMATADTATAEAFCAHERHNTMAPLGWPKEVTSRDPYVFVPLQLQNDSVEALAFVHPSEMLDMCIRYFVPRGWQVVTKLHPKDRNPEMLALAERFTKHPRVTLASSPSIRLVWHASAVAVVNSTVGWESVLAQKPILSFGLSDYSQVTFPIHNECDMDRARLPLNASEKQMQDVLYHYFATKRALDGVPEMVEYARVQIMALLAGKEPPALNQAPSRCRFGERWPTSR